MYIVAKLKFICTSFRNRKNYIFRQCMSIVFILQCYVCKKCLNHTQKMWKHWTFWLNFLLGIYSAVHVPSVYDVLCSI